MRSFNHRTVKAAISADGEVARLLPIEGVLLSTVEVNKIPRSIDLASNGRERDHLSQQ